MHLGSAGSNFKIWNSIASNSILVSVDANQSPLNFKINSKTINDQIIIFNKNKMSKFYLTHDPNCSSLLEPYKLVHENGMDRID